MSVHVADSGGDLVAYSGGDLVAYLGGALCVRVYVRHGLYSCCLCESLYSCCL